jgi:hypothetical protein
MGTGTYSSASWSTYSASVKSKSTKEIFSTDRLDKYLDPKEFTVREARDSEEHPSSTPIIIALDVTGSMGMIATYIAKTGLGVLFQEIIDRGPVKDPQLMFMALGDVYCDSTPIQVSQFESDNKIISQLEKIYVEQGGGGNSSESYDFPWYIASRRTVLDSWDKRKKRGYLFTVGDEMFPYGLKKDEIHRFTGDTAQDDLSAENLLKEAEQKFNVFHVVIEEGNFCRGVGASNVLKDWRTHLGQRVLPLSDHTKLSEVIVSTIQVVEGSDKTKVVDSWDGSTSVVVKKAIDTLVPSGTSTEEGLVTL